MPSNDVIEQTVDSLLSTLTAEEIIAKSVEAFGQAPTSRKNKGGAMSPGLPLEVGDHVEVRCTIDGNYALWDQWFEGIVDAVVEPGVYSIVFDDGDRQPEVQRYQIRRKGAKRLAPYKKDEKVDARLDGGKKLFPGRINRVNADHSYDVIYADGNKEEGVPIEMIFGLQNDMVVLSTFTFSGESDGSQPITLETSMTEANCSNIGLGISGAIMLSAFLPKCT
jgi:hypothetical protein